MANGILIEICGATDIGKKHICDLVARKTGGTAFLFPKIMTGKEFPASVYMVKCLNAGTDLINNTEWWAHIYSAMMYEHRNALERELARNQVVVTTNYTNSYRVWQRTLGFGIDAYFKGFTVNLPKPDKVFALHGCFSKTSENNMGKIPPLLIQKIDRALDSMYKGPYQEIDLSKCKSNFKHIFYNNVSSVISAILRAEYGCNNDPNIKYTKEDFNFR